MEKAEYSEKEKVYKAKRGYRHSKKYNCFMPMHTGKFKVVDCLFCDSEGNVDMGYQYGSPVCVDNLGELINIQGETYGTT